jgi:hypothetical protein
MVVIAAKAFFSVQFAQCDIYLHLMYQHFKTFSVVTREKQALYLLNRRRFAGKYWLNQFAY